MKIYHKSANFISQFEKKKLEKFLSLNFIYSREDRCESFVLRIILFYQSHYYNRSLMEWIFINNKVEIVTPFYIYTIPCTRHNLILAGSPLLRGSAIRGLRPRLFSRPLQFRFSVVSIDLLPTRKHGHPIIRHGLTLF